jgi:hypothetical protein
MFTDSKRDTFVKMKMKMALHNILNDVKFLLKTRSLGAHALMNISFNFNGDIGNNYASVDIFLSALINESRGGVGKREFPNIL